MKIFAAPVFCLIFAVFSACSFDYGNTKTDNEKPDIVMRDVEYVRVRNGDPLARFQAEYAERYEEKKLMNLENFSFEQFENHAAEINATGSAGEASMELDSGDISLTGGVQIAVESEDITINTYSLQWKDKEKQLMGPADDTVDIFRSDGTSFTGRGFSANARERTWSFSSGAEGSYIDNNDDNNENIDAEEIDSELDEEIDSDAIDTTDATEVTEEGES